MEKCLKIFLIFFIIYSYIYPTYASETEVLDSQKDSLNISRFIQKAEDYTKNAFGDNVKMEEVLESALTGKIDNNSIYKSILNLLGKELKNSLRTFRSYFSCNCNS